MRFLRLFSVLTAGLLVCGCHKDLVMDLSGTWALDLQESGFQLDRPTLHETYPDEVRLPGTLDENGKGHVNTDTTTMRLNRLYEFTGTAWYRREIDIPRSWDRKALTLFIERSRITAVWIDDRFIGTNTVVSASQTYALGNRITPGRHLLTVAVNNDPALHTVGGAHAYTDHTMTNWNGMLGRIELRALQTASIAAVQVYPKADQKRVTVKLTVQNGRDTLCNVRFTLRAQTWNTDVVQTVPERTSKMDLAPGKNIIRLTYYLGEDARLWSEYDPTLYRLQVGMSARHQQPEERTVPFGLRDFKAGEYLFTINGTPTFLRGKHDGGTFPLVGYAPTDTASWLHYFRVCKEYGINHIRFHSYTPPEAAWLAADMTGMYVQTELPNWASFTTADTMHTVWMLREGKAILDDFANHASFVMMALGNELSGEAEIADQMVRDLRNYDSRPLYAFGSNNFLSDPFYGKNDDYWVSFRTGREDPGRRYDLRGSASCNEDVESGILNAEYPSSSRTYATAIAPYHMPIIGHEVGQYQVYPNYDEIGKYTGVLRAWNFEVFRKRLEQAGMADQADEFFKASGASMVMLYRAEMEMARRTEHFAGYQLLDLQDYPGQGTALVGILDAFMDSKGLITPEEYREVSNDVVPLLLMDKYCWTWRDTLAAEIAVSYFAPQQVFDKPVQWTLLRDGEALASGQVDVPAMRPGELIRAGRLRVSLTDLLATAHATADQALRLDLQVQIGGTSYKNRYPVWVYPEPARVAVPTAVQITSRLDAGILARLTRGATAIYFPDSRTLEPLSVGPQFINEFWNWLMFKGICESNQRPISQGTLGLLVHPDHPLFTAFPTSGHTEWQWWEIVKHAHPLILDRTEATYRPIVQVIDNIDRNHKLGIVCEWKVGEGKLIVCTADLPKLTANPEACQFYRALLRYAASSDCNPRSVLSPAELTAWFQQR